MKHLPTELLYLLKIYNYIMYEIGLDSARSRAEEIRAYIDSCTFLKDHPGLYEYLSPDKSMEDIITYIKRNEKTYELMGQWRDREQEAIFEAKGIKDNCIGFIGGLTVTKGNGGDAYMLFPNSNACDDKIVFKGAHLENDIQIHSHNILWSEFYRTRECYCWEVFTDKLETVKLSFEDFSAEKVFYNAITIDPFYKNPWEMLSNMASAVYKKHKYDPSLLCEKERKLVPILEFLHNIDAYSIFDSSKESVEAFLSLAESFSLKKVEKTLHKIYQGPQKKHSKQKRDKLLRVLRNEECEGLWRNIYSALCESQDGIPSIDSRQTPPEAENRHRQIEAHLHSLGYSGQYPDFVKIGELKGLHVASSYNVEYFIFNEKKVYYFIHAIDTFLDSEDFSQSFLSGTVILKDSDEPAKDFFSAMFDRKGKSFFSVTHSYMAYENIEKDPYTIIDIAVKRAQLERLSKKEREIEGIPFGICMVFGLCFGLFFSVALLGGLAGIVALILLAFWEIGAFFNAVPWLWLLIGSILASSGIMGIVFYLSGNR